ncbi:hypothetical protein CCACVL1_13951 [Corchorus capsularis]|uniref:Uncharacterized protein n=1 Tax=Corchorus capsularis TaxID=210143 RepID=A0A1R3I8Y1_COCAP|nr:hypothetical protein CCACVL1_13951 [Corchorus capsularis]
MTNYSAWFCAPTSSIPNEAAA